MKTLVFLVAAVTVVNGLTNLQINKITVKIGPAKTDGTDDDMFIKICDGAKCCQTKQLRHLLGSEWVKNKTEVWDGGKLGNCSKILFESGSPDLDVTLLKEAGGKDDLKVTSVVLEGAPTTEKTNIFRFTCGSFIFAGSDTSATSKTQRCLSNKASSSRPKSPSSRPKSPNSRPKSPNSRPKSPNSRPSNPQRAPQKTADVKINKITVKMAPGNNDGTDDDVVMKICDPTKCCFTKELSHFLSSEWVKNKTEVWDGNKLGNCSNILFENGPSLTATILKPGKDDLRVSSIILEGGPVTSKTNTLRFTCGEFKLSSKDTSKSGTCLNNVKPTPAFTPENVKITKFLVQIGDEGTNDDVKMKVCSVPKRGAPVCCDTPVLSTLLSDDWSRRDNETWAGRALGSCNNKQLSIEKSISNLHNGQIKVTVDKKGKDTLVVKNIIVETETDPVKTLKRFECGSFTIDGKKGTSQTKTCEDRGSISASQVGACLRNGKNCGGAISGGTNRPPTTRRPFRSGNGK